LVLVFVNRKYTETHTHTLRVVCCWTLSRVRLATDHRTARVTLR